GLYMSGDRYLLLLLMWCILLPTGARLSVRPAPNGVTRLRSFAGAGLLVQIMVVYVLTGLKKTGAEWFDVGGQGAQARYIASWVSQARHEASSERIAARRHDDGHLPRGMLGREGRGCPPGQDHVDLESDQLLRELRESFRPTIGRPVLDHDIP